jgi:predicted DsbA family dithiol-disulfide isomerase
MESVDKSVLIDKKFAETSTEKRKAITNRVIQIGSSLGINFAWGGKIGNSRDAHRLIYLSEGKEPVVRNALVEGLFQANHEREMDISDKELLRGIAVDAGIEAAEVDAWLATDEGGAVVDEEAARSRTETTGVPAFFVQGLGRIDGAQDVSEFMEVFIRIKETSSS